ncbi:MAG: hypothetical protein ACRD91_01680 [Nitrosopumilaceae archaeon]
MKFFTAKKNTDEKKEETDKTEAANSETEVKEKQQEKKKLEIGKFGFGSKKEKQDVSHLQNEQKITSKQDEIKKIEPESAVKSTVQSKKSDSAFENTNITSTEKIKELVEIVTNSNENAIEPIINFEKNSITYPILAKIGESEENMEFLEKLSSNTVGILEREIYERLIVCPQHPEDLSVSVRMYCPDCGSMDIRKLHLIEHKVCGYIAEKNEFGVVSVSDVKTCPNCKREIKDFAKEIRMPGQWNKCYSCNKKFDNAKIKLHCRRFNHDFELTDIESVIVPRYKIKTDAGENVNILTLLPQLKKVITSLGFTVEELSAVKGKSGVSHQTNIFAHNNENKTIAVFIKTAKEIVEDTEVNATVVNVIDISPTWAVFIGIPAISERAIAMASTHKMIIVTGNDHNKIASEVAKKLSEKIAISHVST